MGRKTTDDKRRKLGLCAVCGKVPAPPGKRVCKPCIDISVIKNRAKAEKRKQSGLCPRCGESPPAEGRICCVSCLSKAVTRVAEMRKNRGENGLCKKCGKVKPEENKLHCSWCLSKNTKENAAIKKKVMDHYGGKCACCGEDNIVFLSIDHINGGGDKHRREIGSGGSRLYRWIITNNYPDDLQVLCFNCNQGRAVNGGICPHQQETGGIRGCGNGHVRLVQG